MTLIAILASLVLERLLEQVHELRRYERYQDYAVWMRQRLRGDPWEGRLGVLALLAPVLLLTGLLQTAFDDLLFGLPGLLFAIVVLVFCLGPRDLGVELGQYREALSSGDEEAAARRARGLLGQDAPQVLDVQARAVAEAVLIQANVRIFAVLFWFAVLGPLGAVLYRAAAELCRQTQADNDEFAWAARQLCAILDWAPARLTAFGYALSGHFEAAVLRWRGVLAVSEHWLTSAEPLLAAVGMGALDLKDDIHDSATWNHVLQSAISLVWRTLVLWVFVIALLTLAGWAA